MQKPTCYINIKMANGDEITIPARAIDYSHYKGMPQFAIYYAEGYGYKPDYSSSFLRVRFILAEDVERLDVHPWAEAVESYFEKDLDPDYGKEVNAR